MVPDQVPIAFLLGYEWTSGGAGGADGVDGVSDTSGTG